jgi:hypothetical protein
VGLNKITNKNTGAVIDACKEVGLKVNRKICYLVTRVQGKIIPLLIDPWEMWQSPDI